MPERRISDRSPVDQPLGGWGTIRQVFTDTLYLVQMESAVAGFVLGTFSGAFALAQGKHVLCTWRGEGIAYRIEAVGIPTTGSGDLDETVGPGAPDDGHWTEDLGDYNPNASPIDLNATATASLRSHIWLFFSSIAIPAGANILQATITMKKGALTASPICDIHMNDTDNAVPPVSVADMDSKALTTASVEWTIPGAEPTSTVIESTDFTAAVQEVIDRPGWASGQDLMVILKAQTTGGLHEFPTTIADDHHLLIQFGPDPNVPTEQISTSDLGDTELAGQADADLWIWDDAASAWKNKALSGDATIDKAGVLSVAASHSGSAHHAEAHNLDSHATRDHGDLNNVGTTDHAAQVLQAAAEAGVETTDRMWTAERVAQAIAAQAGGGTPLTVEEEDGTPSVANVSTIKVTNGTLTDNGSGSVSVDTGGGGGGIDEELAVLASWAFSP